MNYRARKVDKTGILKTYNSRMCTIFMTFRQKMNPKQNTVCSQVMRYQLQYEMNKGQFTKLNTKFNSRCD